MFQLYTLFKKFGLQSFYTSFLQTHGIKTKGMFNLRFWISTFKD